MFITFGYLQYRTPRYKIDLVKKEQFPWPPRAIQDTENVWTITKKVTWFTYESDVVHLCPKMKVLKI